MTSAFHEVRQAQNFSVIHSQVWHLRIPLKISFFMLLLLVGKLPLTDALWRMGVQLASKYLCCQEGATELLEHVFSEGQVAMGVWNYFGSICGVARRGSSLRAWLTAWWMSFPMSEKSRVLYSVLPRLTIPFALMIVPFQFLAIIPWPILIIFAEIAVSVYMHITSSFNVSLLT